jgi:hypothetical protein
MAGQNPGSRGRRIRFCARGSVSAAVVLGLALLFAALALFGEEVAADVQGQEEGDEAEEADEDDGGDVHTGSAGGAQVVAAELEVEAAARQS